MKRSRRFGLADDNRSSRASPGRLAELATVGRMRRATLALAVGVIGFGALAGIAMARQASTVKMTAKLKPLKMTSASGRFTGTLLSSSNGRSKLSWTLTYQHLSSRVTKAELVVPAKGKQGAV